jgi:hypothetical protein
MIEWLRLDRDELLIATKTTKNPLKIVLSISLRGQYLDCNSKDIYKYIYKRAYTNTKSQLYTVMYNAKYLQIMKDKY